MRTRISSVLIAALLLGPSQVMAQRPSKIRIDRYQVEADQRMAKGDSAGALESTQKILVLQKEHDFTLPAEFHFKAAQVAFAGGAFPEALKSVNQYLLAIETATERTTCAGQPEGTACWMELSNHPDCYVWNSYLQPDETATWTGECVEGVAEGAGTLKEIYNDGQNTDEHTGRLQAGRRHGRWVLRLADGSVNEGPMVEGKHHGHWVSRFADGNVEEGPMVEGKRHGQWVLRSADGTRHTLTFKDGKPVY